MKNVLIKPMNALLLGMIFGVSASAQTFTTLHDFSGSEGDTPLGDLLLLSNKLYGTARKGGTYQYGSVFAVNPNGTGFTNLVFFDGTNGSYPFAGLVASGGTLYGTTDSGGSSGNGTIFAINTDGTGFTNLHHFSQPVLSTNVDGTHPDSKLAISGNVLYGVTQYGGSGAYGTAFSLHTDGTSFSNLCNFSGSNGKQPVGGVLLLGDKLYGTTIGGGTYNTGTIFAVNTNGTGFVNLYHFTAFSSSSPFTNSDGAYPQCMLSASGNRLYGTTTDGGDANNGTLFAINTDGSGFTNLHVFSQLVSGTNSDGSTAFAGPILSSNILYGATKEGGVWGNGVIFSLDTNGGNFSIVHAFSATTVTSPKTNSDGARPTASLMISGSALYGGAPFGGAYGLGTLFSISPQSAAPYLNITSLGTNVILSWPVIGYNLQSAPLVNGTYTNIPGAFSPFTNPATEAQRYFRLSQ